MNASQYDINKLFGLQTVKSEPSIPPAANTDTPISKVEALMHYESLKAKLDDIKLEMDKMKSIIVDGFILKSGTNKVKIGERQIKIMQKFGIKVDYDALQKSWDTFTPLMQASFKFSANVVNASYKILSQSEKSIADEYITSTPHTPSIELGAKNDE